MVSPGAVRTPRTTLATLLQQPTTYYIIFNSRGICNFAQRAHYSSEVFGLVGKNGYLIRKNQYGYYSSCLTVTSFYQPNLLQPNMYQGTIAPKLIDGLPDYLKLKSRKIVHA